MPLFFGCGKHLVADTQHHLQNCPQCEPPWPVLRRWPHLYARAIQEGHREPTPCGVSGVAATVFVAHHESSERGQ